MNRRIDYIVMLFIAAFLSLSVCVTAKPKKIKSISTCPQQTKNSCSKQTKSFCPLSQELNLSTESLFNEINYARANPKKYAAILEERLDAYSGAKKGSCKEAIAFLKKQPERKHYTFSRALSQAACDHCVDMDSKNFTGHTSSNGSDPGKRIAKYGNTNAWAENIAYGSLDARDVVVNWIIDHGVQNRGHRKAIFSDDYVYCGVAWFTHPTWSVSVTADFASSAFTTNMIDDNIIMEFTTFKK